MHVAALVLWIATALGGLTMTGIWLANRGPAQHAEGASRIGPRRLAAHAGTAAAGLVLWIVHVASDSDAAGWLAFGLLPVVALIGSLMFMTWLAGRGADTGDVTAAEQRIPPVVVAAHGLLAVATAVAVLIALVS